MDERTLNLKKCILSRIMRIDEPDVLRVVDLLLERAEHHGPAPAPAAMEAILGDVARALRGGGASSN